MKVSHSREAKYFYRKHPDVGCVTLESDAAGFSFKTELSVKEAISLVDDLIDLIEWITDEEITWSKVESKEGESA